MKLYFTVIFLLLLSASCSTTEKYCVEYNTVESGAIPPDFGKDTSTLICILSGQKSFDKYVKKHFDNKYGGQVAYVEGTTYGKEEYSDTSEYRYILRSRTASNLPVVYPNHDPKTHGRYARTSQNQLYIVDRKTGKTYYSTFGSGNFGGLYKGYAIVLENKRLNP